MIGRAAIIVALAATGCWSTARHDPPLYVADGPVAGTRWITPLDLWRVNARIGALVVLGPTALVAGAAGWVAEVDLRSGRVVRETSLGTMTIHELVRLRDGRVLVLGVADKQALGVELDPHTLEETPIELGAAPSEMTYPGVHARVMADGGVLLAGPGLPLAIYDPRTWKPRQVIASEVGWSDPFVTRDAIYAKRAYTTYKFDLSGQRDTTFSKPVVAAAGETVITRESAGGKLQGTAVTAGGARVALGEIGYWAQIDPDGRRIADVSGRTLTVRSLADGHVLRTIDLGPRDGASTRLAFAGDRVVVGDATVVRVVDLASGYITPRGPAPFDVDQLLVDNDGTVVVAGVERIRLRDGTRLGREVLSGYPLASPADELARFAIRQPLYVGDRRPAAITVFTPGRRRRVLALSRKADEGWLGRNGRVAAVLEWDTDKPQKLVRSQGDELVDVFTFNLDAIVWDVDVDAGVAALAIKGTTYLVDLDTGAPTGVTLRAPKCGEYAVAALERGGTRAVTIDDDVLALWDRTRGEVIGSLAFDKDLYAPSWVRAHGELLMQFSGGFVLWAPEKGEIRVAKVPNLGLAEVSPDGRVLGLMLSNGRVAVADYAAMRAALPVQPAKAVADIAKDCGAADPFQLEEEEVPDHDGLDSILDDPCSGDDDEVDP